jgi:hypothetical protein
MCLRISEYFKKKEEIKISDRFIACLEVIYALILACAVVKVVDVIQLDISFSLATYWHILLISCLFLIRFVFAPYKNIKILGEKAIGWKWTIMPFDGIVLLLHSFVFYYMCLNIKDFEIFYRSFFYLLLLNALWILTIILRTRDNSIHPNRIWFYNNLIFVLLYLIIPLSHISNWQLSFVLALSNSLIDLGLAYSGYFT